jgi:hypothetical protein
MRFALLALALAFAGPAGAGPGIEAARYGDPTTRYDHGALGDKVEWGSLTLVSGGVARRFMLPGNMVFEDTAPRLADLDGDGGAEAIVVETDLARGARLAVWGARGRIAATPFIGAPHRWLAPLGAGDLDGDGQREIAYVDRPHLARVLRLVRLEDGELREVASLAGVTNHHFGDSTISGGLRSCGGAAEIVVARSDWSALLALAWDGRAWHERVIGRDTSAVGVSRAMACR